MENVATNTRQF